MRLISFETKGRASFGIVVGDKVIDAGARLAGEFGGLRDILTAGAVNLLRGMEGLEPEVALADIRFLPLIPDPAAKILCVGINYLPHIEEMGRERPDYPVIFVRFADSLVGHGGAVRLRRRARGDHRQACAARRKRSCSRLCRRL